MDTPIDEHVTVWAFFDSGIFPIAMNWRRRLIKFTKVIFTSTKRVGDVKIISLICASETNNFELEYNSSNQVWRLRKVINES